MDPSNRVRVGCRVGQLRHIPPHTRRARRHIVPTQRTEPTIDGASTAPRASITMAAGDSAEAMLLRRKTSPRRAIGFARSRRASSESAPPVSNLPRPCRCVVYFPWSHPSCRQLSMMDTTAISIARLDESRFRPEGVLHSSAQAVGAWYTALPSNAGNRLLLRCGSQKLCDQSFVIAIKRNPEHLGLTHTQGHILGELIEVADTFLNRQELSV